MPLTKGERIAEVLLYAQNKGDEAACEVFGIKDDTIRRYKDIYKKKYGNIFGQDETLKKIVQAYTPNELKAIAAGGRIMPSQFNIPIIDFTGERVKFGVFSDLHTGSIYFEEEAWDKAVSICEEEGVEFYLIPGDITDGMDAAKSGHIYELDKLGFDQQKEYGITQIKKLNRPSYLISGNHDWWYFIRGEAGANIVKDICEAVDGAEYLGHSEGDLNIKGVNIKLWHGADCNSYAVSYRLQKLIESFTGGEKPQILIAGHTHKELYMFERHIHCLSAGAMSRQSRWMRDKRIANHMGFHTVEVTIRDGQVCRFKVEWFPFYM